MNEKIITIPVGPLGVNCYIVYKTDSDKALVIDPGGDFSLIQSVLKENKLTAGAVLITHCHFDHIMATSEFNKLKVPVYMSENDVSFINSNGNLAKYFGVKFIPFIVDNRLIEGFLTVCGLEICVYETPGHTKGSVCIRIGNALFTGDTLFKESYGRTDFPSGDGEELVKSIKKIFEIAENLVVYPGHNETTTLEHEKKHNPIKFYF